MSYMSLVAPCFGCGRLFTSNPDSVPSYQNEPICRDCMEVVNRRRAENGLPLWPILPDAYDAVEVDG
jgi:hypothetical protein